MERLIRWFVKNTVAANMVMLFILVAGLLTLPRIRMEVFPDINVDIVSISVIYPGASPKDVEEGICYRIEEKLTGLKGIKRIRSLFNSLTDWKDINKLIPNKFLSSKKSKKAGISGIFSGALELVKEEDLIIKQSKLFDKIYIKQKI